MARLNFFGSGSFSDWSLPRFREFVLLVIVSFDDERFSVESELWWKLVSKGI